MTFTMTTLPKEHDIVIAFGGHMTAKSKKPVPLVSDSIIEPEESDTVHLPLRIIDHGKNYYSVIDRRNNLISYEELKDSRSLMESVIRSNEGHVPRTYHVVGHSESYVSTALNNLSVSGYPPDQLVISGNRQVITLDYGWVPDTDYENVRIVMNNNIPNQELHIYYGHPRTLVALLIVSTLDTVLQNNQSILTNSLPST